MNKKFLVDVKAKYLLLETKVQDMKTEWRRLGDVARGLETVSRVLEVSCVSGGFGGHFAGLMIF